jgi:hypothetical protein
MEQFYAGLACGIAGGWLAIFMIWALGNELRSQRLGSWMARKYIEDCNRARFARVVRNSVS